MPKAKKNEEVKPLTRRQRAAIKARASAKKVKDETKKAMGTAIVAAFGFLIALVWKDVITEWVKILTSASPIQGKLIEALLVTFIAVVGIVLVTKLLSSDK